MDTNLQEENVIVTGASGGIGQAIARSFIAEGAKVVVHYHRNRESAESLVKEFGSNATMIQADLTQDADVKNLFQKASASLGPISVFVANAGDWPSDHQQVDEVSVERWNQTIANNLTSTFLCMKHFLRHARFEKLTSPAAVMIGSTAGMVGEAGHCDYAAAKAALIHGLLPSLKNEFSRAIPAARINVVCPGWTMTPMTEKFSDNKEGMIQALQTMSLRKFASPEDIADAVTFLASCRAGHITGQALTVAGGMEGRVLYSKEEIEI